MWQTRLEEDRVHAELRVEERHVAVDLHEEIDALVALLEVHLVTGQSLRAARTAEGPS